MDDVARIRDRIDELDQEIVRLLKNRHENAKFLGAASSDIVVPAVPSAETVRVPTETTSLMTSGSLRTDLSSVKTGVSDRVAENTPKGFEYVSLHPLFGPRTDHLYG